MLVELKRIDWSKILVEIVSLLLSSYKCLPLTCVIIPLGHLELVMALLKTLDDTTLLQTSR